MVIKQWFGFLIFISFLLLDFSFLPISTVQAQELIQSQVEIVKAEVLEVLKQEVREIPGTDTSHSFQEIRIKILEGEQVDKVIILENDYLNLKAGEKFYLRHEIDSFEDRELYAVFEPYRLPAIYGFMALFVVCVVVFGGWQGIRGLLSLVASFLFIFFLLFPGIMAGYSPILISIGVASLIIILGSYVTHGFNKTTSAAVVGMIVTVILTSGLAYFAVHSAQLSGVTSDEAVYLNFNTRGAIDFVGLLLGGILIGLLGVLYDAAISQAIVIEELSRVGPHLSRSFIFKRALRVGREHIGALVNTLAIAYVGVSLPLLLLVYSFNDASLTLNLNREMFATEIIRTMIGSIGLVLAVPITSLIAVLMIVKQKQTENPVLLAEEKAVVEEFDNSHHHHHH